MIPFMMPFFTAAQCVALAEVPAIIPGSQCRPTDIYSIGVEASLLHSRTCDFNNATTNHQWRSQQFVESWRK